MTWPSPVDSRTVWLGRKLPAWGAAEAGAAAVTLPKPMASTARAVPRRTRLFLVMLFILTGSHRNDHYGIATGNTDDGADRGGSRPARTGRSRFRRALRDASALEARHVTAGHEGRIVVLRTIGDGQQQL